MSTTTTTTTTATTRDRGDRYGPMEWAQLYCYCATPRYSAVYRTVNIARISYDIMPFPTVGGGIKRCWASCSQLIHMCLSPSSINWYQSNGSDRVTHSLRSSRTFNSFQAALWNTPVPSSFEYSLAAYSTISKTWFCVQFIARNVLQFLCNNCRISITFESLQLLHKMHFFVQ